MKKTHAAPLGLRRHLGDHGVGVRAQDPQGQRIGEDAPLFQHLVRRAVGGGG